MMWLEDFIKPNKSVNTYSSYYSTVEKYIIPFPLLGELKLCDIRVIHVENFYQD